MSAISYLILLIILFPSDFFLASFATYLGLYIVIYSNDIGAIITLEIYCAMLINSYFYS